uniref:A-kinase anchor protein 2 C-terminal domain-containing protein n=1 Tax=Sphenodon punctatus TaxID=8508 RepID=A0A8D0GPF7_SPHPU
MNEPPRQEMDRITRNLIFSISQNASPKYENQHDTGVCPRSESDDDEFAVYNYDNQRAENGLGWRPIHLLENKSELSTNSLNGGKYLWRPSPDRESNLELVKTGTLYDIRAYKEETKPSKLFSEQKEELGYRIPCVDISPEKTKELEDERRKVIQSQAVKKRSTMAEKWSSMEELDSINTGSSSKYEGKQGGKYSEFALYFDSASPARVQTPVDSENIDRGKINFAAARQQFLLLEKTKPSSLFGSRKQVMSPRPESMRNIYERGWQSPSTVKGSGDAFTIVRGSGDADWSSQRGPAGYNSKEEMYTLQRTTTEREDPNGRTTSHQSLSRTSSKDDLDSSLGETSNTFRMVYISDGSPFDECSDDLLDLREGDQDLVKARDETPIEREIRLAMVKEENLRKERGIQRMASRDELVEIQTKPLLSTSLLSPSHSRKGKDKARISFYVQREIEQETKREEDLKKEGRLPGTYDKGTPQELGERRRLFEQDDIPPSPHKVTSAKKPKELRGTSSNEFTWEQTMDHGLMGDTADGNRLPNPTVNLLSFKAYQPFSTSDSSKSRTGSERPSYNQPFPNYSRPMDGESFRAGLPSTQEQGDPAEKFVLRKEYFAIPAWKPTFSFSSDQGTRSLGRKDGGLERVASHEEQYTLKAWKPQTSSLIEQEIQDALQREQELQEQRKRLSERGFVPGSSTWEKGSRGQLSSQSSAASGISGNYSVSDSPVFAPASYQPGMLRLVSSSSPSSLPTTHTGRLGSELAWQSPTQSLLEEKERRQWEDRKVGSPKPSVLWVAWTGAELKPISKFIFTNINMCVSRNQSLY